MAQLNHRNSVKKEKLCSTKTPVLLTFSLFRALKLTFPTDVGRIIEDEQITSDLGYASPGQYVEALSPARFRPAFLQKYLLNMSIKLQYFNAKDSIEVRIPTSPRPLIVRGGCGRDQTYSLYLQRRYSCVV